MLFSIVPKKPNLFVRLRKDWEKKPVFFSNFPELAEKIQPTHILPHTYAQLCIQQMERLNTAIQEKRPNRQHEVFLLHDNARPHITKEAIQMHGWELLPHSPYSPNLAPTDFHLFRSYSNAMREVSFNTDAEI